jgi:hypothetical protein
MVIEGVAEVGTCQARQIRITIIVVEELFRSREESARYRFLWLEHLVVPYSDFLLHVWNQEFINVLVEFCA